MEEKNAKAYKWWSSLSIEEQKAFVRMHPFFKNFDLIYIIRHKTGIPELYQYLVEGGTLTENQGDI